MKMNILGMLEKQVKALEALKNLPTSSDIYDLTEAVILLTEEIAKLRESYITREYKAVT